VKQRSRCIHVSVGNAIGHNGHMYELYTSPKHISPPFFSEALCHKDQHPITYGRWIGCDRAAQVISRSEIIRCHPTSRDVIVNGNVFLLSYLK